MRSPVLLTVIALSTACDDAAPPADSCPAPTIEAGDPSPQLASAPAAVRVGASTYSGQGLTTTRARAELRFEPLPALHVVDSEEGACRRLAAAIYHCQPACPSDALCTGENLCTTVGLARSAGALTVTVGDDPAVLQPDATLRYQSDELAPAACSSVDVTAAGDDFPPFALESALVPPVEITNLAELGYFAGEGLTVRWQPADPGARVRITFRADSASHGAVYPSIIECDARDDAGEIDVPVSMMDAHIAEFGCGLCPSTSVTRYRRAITVADETEVELVTEDEQLIFLYPGGVGVPRGLP